MADLRLQLKIAESINYAVQENRLPILREAIIINDSDNSYDGLQMEICTVPKISENYQIFIDHIPEKAFYKIELDHDIQLEPDYFASLTERTDCILKVTLRYGEEIILEDSLRIAALAYDEWQGLNSYPEVLSAFVIPNHPVVAKLNSRTSDFMNEWTGSPSLDAYQTQDTDRVHKMFAATYRSIQEQNIVYVEAPASFEDCGQRIRLCDNVMQQKMGNCIELALTFASCLEAMRLHPIIILMKGHAFVGVWLENKTFPEAVIDDVSALTKRLAKDINEIAVVECTLTCAGRNNAFDIAEAKAISELNVADDFLCLIDVFRARLSHIRPLPQRIYDECGWHIEKGNRDEDDLTAAPDMLGQKINVGDIVGERNQGKVAQWEAKLLDLGMRNTLLNMRISRSVIPILSPSLDNLEDALSDGNDYAIKSAPAEYYISPEDRQNPEAYVISRESSLLIEAEFKNRRLRASLSDNELQKSIVLLYRSAKTSLEENGANSLYLALGILKWYETEKSKKARYAPLVMIPIEIVRKSASIGYIIRIRDEETQFNITLLEMLHRNFGMNIGGLDPLPTDEHGSDIRKIFAILRTAIMDQPRWDLIETSFLGIFSFTQFIMWNDVRNRMEELKKNKIVTSLIDGKIEWDVEPMEIGAHVPEDGALVTVPADASQLYAIEAAAKGESFVLHGPPGTGKSQTITAMIANALAQKKTVLFVTEKMAALSVVEERLNKIGIGSFCLELHSNKSKKKDVLSQLNQAVEASRKQTPEEYNRELAEIARLRTDLDSYAEALHKTRRSGLSVFEMVSEYEKDRQAPELIHFDAAFTKDIRPEDLAAQKEMIQRLAAAATATEGIPEHPLKFIGSSHYSQSLKTRLSEEVGNFRNDINNLESSANVFLTASGLDDALSEETMRKLDEIYLALGQCKGLTILLSKKEDIYLALDQIQKVAEHVVASQKIKSMVLEKWDEGILVVDVTDLKSRWEQAESEWFIPKMINENQIWKQVCSYSKPGNKGDIPEIINVVLAYQNEKHEIQNLNNLLGPAGTEFFESNNNNFEVSCSVARDIANGCRKLLEITGSEQMRIKHGADARCVIAGEKFHRAYNSVQKTKNILYSDLLIDDTNVRADGWLAKQKDICDSISCNADILREWMAYRTCAEEAEKCGLLCAVNALETGVSPEVLLPAYRKAVYRSLIEYTVDNDEILNSFSGAVFDEKIRQFNSLDKDLINLNRKEIYCRIVSNIPDFNRITANSSEVSTLKRAIKSNSHGLSIRQLFRQIPNLLPKLCPCMLMSPISAAQYLDPEREPFDLVIFDEASQLPTYKAVGAIARGKDAVIVGDPKQMPPTSFFMSNYEDEDDDAEEDLESILDDCLAINMPETHLLWHYRSRHESLIAFSNREFYDNALYTFPSFNDLDSKIKFVHIDGFFERGGNRQNIKEAESIVKELTRRAHSEADSSNSVGVVTFNISQTNLIDDLVTDVCKSDPIFEKWINRPEEALFIKNLENVQGDERDVILFSICYGPDRSGKVSVNFGPLNKEGGGRRLNVAVSRARCEMIVFSSMTSDQIDLSKTKSNGVAALKAFLKYAEKGMLPETKESAIEQVNAENGIIDNICAFLAEQGYETKKLVGHSKYHIDIGVINPKKKDQYIVGILLDGKTYGSAKTVRDREIAQVSILGGLGWHVYRIWTLDWIDNSQKELQKVLAFIHEVEKLPEDVEPRKAEVNNSGCIDNADYQEKAKCDNESTEENADDSISDQSSIVENDNIISYKGTNLTVSTGGIEDFMSDSNLRQHIQVAQTILNNEAPISQKMLVKRLAQAYAIAHTGSRIQKRALEIIARLDLRTTESEGRIFLWKKEQIPNEYSIIRKSGEGINQRDAQDVPEEEIANAIVAVLQQQIGLPEMDLLRETAKMLGYLRLGTNVIDSMRFGLRWAKITGRIKESPPEYYTLESE